MSGIFNVFFDGMNWVGVVLEDNGESQRAGKYIFGGEPKPHEIFEWCKKGCPGLVLTEVAKGALSSKGGAIVNPKRMQREARRAAENKQMGTYAQEKLREALELRKKAAAITNKERRAAETEARFEKRMQKKKKKRRGH